MLPARRLVHDPHVLEDLLRTGQVRRAPALTPAQPRPLSTGLPALDAALGGGLARGQLHEIVAPPGASPWARLARRAEKHCGAVLILARAPQAGTFACASIELERGASLWEGAPGAPVRLLRGVRSDCAVTRHKRMPPSRPLSLHLPLEAQ